VTMFAEFTTVIASTKRKGLTTGFTANLSGLNCTPLAPIDPETRLRLQLNTPHTLWETYLEGDHDIKEGDKLVIDSVEFPIKTIAPWTWPPENYVYLRVIVEDLRN
jgi:hypothetical protein